MKKLAVIELLLEMVAQVSERDLCDLGIVWLASIQPRQASLAQPILPGGTMLTKSNIASGGLNISAGFCGIN